MYDDEFKYDLERSKPVQNLLTLALHYGTILGLILICIMIVYLVAANTIQFISGAIVFSALMLAVWAETKTFRN